MARLIEAAKAAHETFVKCLITGASGSGKTTCVAKAPMPLILEPASQAITSIRAANPQAQILLVESIKDFRDALYSLRTGNPIDIEGLPGLEVTLTEDPACLPPGKAPEVHGTIKIQSIVLDDLEEIQEMLKAEAQGNAPTMTQQGWGVMLEKNMAMLRAFRAVRCNVFVCAKVLRTQDNDRQVWELALYGSKFKPLLPGLFNAVAFMYRKAPSENDEREFVAGFKLPEQYMTKCHPALEAVEDPDPSHWWRKIREWQDQLSSVAMPTDKTILPSDYKPPATMQRRGSQRRK